MSGDGVKESIKDSFPESTEDICRSVVIAITVY